MNDQRREPSPDAYVLLASVTHPGGRAKAFGDAFKALVRAMIEVNDNPSRRHLGNVGSSKEKRIWVIRAKEIKAKRNSRKRPTLIQRKKERRKKKRRTNKCPVLSGEPPFTLEELQGMMRR